MGYDINGQKPTALEGTHFRMAIMTWPLLATVLLKFAPEECSPCEEWYGQDCYGCGLDAAQSLRLAAKLKELIAEGSILEHIFTFQTPEEDGGTYVWLSEHDLREFISFLEACGGFEIT